MADDLPQRPYRSALPPTRGPAAPSAPAGNDPLAELARLIGQNDPFGEFGRDAGRQVDTHADTHAGAPHQSEAALDWPPQTQRRDLAGQAPAAPPLADPQQFGSAAFDRPPFGGAHYQAAAEPVSYGVPGYPPPEAGGADFGYDAYAPQDQDPNQALGYGQYGPEDDDYYDDVPNNRRRIGIIAIAGVFALAVIGTAGAFGYRAIFGSSSSSAPPPVIKADTTPSKIVPAAATKNAQESKMITDRVNERGQGEKLVSREEQPVPITTDKPANAIFPQDQGQIPANAAQLGSGIVGGDAKRVRTIVIHPDQPNGASETMPQAATPQPEPAAAPQPQPQPQPRVVQTTPARPTAPPRTIAEAAAAPAPRPPVARAEPPAPSNAPLSLSPNATAPARAAPAARRVASAPAAIASSGGYAVQVTARRSEADAQAAFRSLQAKYPGQLGGHQPLIKRVDLGAKGIYYRAMVGPYGSAGEANSVCSSLKAAGGACIVQRN